jgi:UDP-glucuronate decarboxylase
MTVVNRATPFSAGRGKRVLVTGGAGFLGSHLCERLLADGHIVYCLDNASTGSLDNIAHLREHRLFHFVLQDVTQPLGTDVEEIYNLACPASPVHYQADPIHTLKTCVIGAINVLELARRCQARVLQASTSEVYGDPAVHPQREDYWGNVNPTGPRACYDEGKRCAETLFFDYARSHRIAIKVARIFNTYGPRMAENDGRIVSNFIVQALQGRPLTVYGDGSQTRSFCFVSDMVEALVRFMGTSSDITGPINLGNPHEVPVLDLARRIIRLTGTASRIEFRPLPADDPTRRRPDIACARQALEWEPTQPLEAGLQATISYFQSVLGTTVARRPRVSRRNAAAAV